ncbi:type VII secretion protein EccC, partial [Actinoplanes sp. NPDC051633]
MAMETVRRPARRPAPELPSGELVLDAPPEIPAPAERSWTQTLTMLPMVVILGAVLLMYSGSAGPTARLVIFVVLGVVVLALVLVAVLRTGGPSGATMAHARRLYLRRLAQHRFRMRRDIERQRAATAFLHPEPSQLWAVAAGPRLWERRAGDEDFAVVRVGTGTQEPSTALVPPSTKPLEQLEPLSALALRRFIRTYAAVPELPLALPLTGFARVHVQGDRARAVALVRAMLGQLATMHAPDDVRIAVCAAPDRLAAWDWVKWLPHAHHPELTDAAGPARLIGFPLLDSLLSTRPRFDPSGPSTSAGPQIVVVVDGGDVPVGGLEGVVVIDLGPAPRALDHGALVLDVSGAGSLAAAGAPIGVADALSAAETEALARQLAPLRLSGADAGEPVLSADLGLADLLDLGDPYAFD